MVQGDKPGQRTWFVGGEDDNVDNNTAQLPQTTQESDEPANAHATTEESDAPHETHEAVPASHQEEHADNQLMADDDFLAADPADLEKDQLAAEKKDAVENAKPAQPEKTDSPTQGAVEASVEGPADPQSATQSATQAAAPADDELESTLVQRKSLLAPLEETPAEAKPEVHVETDPDKAIAIEAERRAQAAEDEVSDSMEWDGDKEDPVKTSREREAAIFEGATVVPAVPSRASAHLWALVLTIILVPVAWYLTWDSACRLTLPTKSQWNVGQPDPYALTELGFACVALFVLVLVARWSSLGAFLMGLVLTGAGLPFLIIPAQTKERLEPVVSALQHQSEFTGNIAHHLVQSGSTGFLVMAGILLLALGFVSHGARRKGRKDFMAKRKVERTKRTRGIK